MPRGIPNDSVYFRDPLRFMKRVIISESGCKWEWPMNGSHGYGVFRCFGQETTAHRASYLIFVGPIAEKQQVHHTCHNRRCVNPAHLETIDIREHGRMHSPGTYKTHCKYGHEFTKENTILKGTNRNCRQCRDRNNKEWRSKKV